MIKKRNIQSQLGKKNLYTNTFMINFLKARNRREYFKWNVSTSMVHWSNKTLGTSFVLSLSNNSCIWSISFQRYLNHAMCDMYLLTFFKALATFKATFFGTAEMMIMVIYCTLFIKELFMGWTHFLYLSCGQIGIRNGKYDQYDPYETKIKRPFLLILNFRYKSLQRHFYKPQWESAKREYR